jgi:hypothetical protein
MQSSSARCAILILGTLVGAPGLAVGQGIAPLRLGGGSSLWPSPSPFPSPRQSPLSLHPATPMATALPLCTMPVMVPDLSQLERMPGSHAPGPGVIGTERFGCFNPLGPRPTTTRDRVPEHP